MAAPLLLLLLLAVAAAEKNKHYHVGSLCKNHFLQQQYRKIDGALLRSQNEPNLDCVITFQTDTILQRFMLRFDQLQLDCNDHLLVYDGAHTNGHHKADLSCRHTRQSVGTIYTRTNFVTLKYKTDGWGTDSNGFQLVITAFKEKTELTCREFRCARKEFCVSTDLLCDGVNHCGDNSDETTTSLCADELKATKIWGVHLAVFGAVAGSVGVVLLALTVGVVVCCCRRRRRRDREPPPGAAHDAAGRIETCSRNGRPAAENRPAENRRPPAIGRRLTDSKTNCRSVTTSWALFSAAAPSVIRWCLAD